MQSSTDGSQPQIRSAEDELDDYLSTPRLPPTADVLEFWKRNATVYPKLAELSRMIFGVPSGSASAERCFSAAGLITRVHRLSLRPQSLEKLIFLKVNSKLLLDQSVYLDPLTLTFHHFAVLLCTYVLCLLVATSGLHQRYVSILYAVQTLIQIVSEPYLGTHWFMSHTHTITHRK